MTTRRTDEAWDQLVAAAMQRRGNAREELDAAVWEFACGRARSANAILALGRDEDHSRNVAQRVLANLRRPGGLSAFGRLNKEERPTFRAWLSTVVDRAALDYVRTLRGRRAKDEKPDGTDGETVSAKSLLNLFASSVDLETLGTRPRFTEQQRIRQLVGFAEQHLAPQQLAALRMWLKDEQDPAIAAALGVSPARAKALRRSAIEALRSHFRKRRA